MSKTQRRTVAVIGLVSVLLAVADLVLLVRAAA